jgi:hypothetical protein
MENQYTLSDVARAIATAVPCMTLVHFGKLSLCHAASAVGTLILREYGFNSESVPVDALVVQRGEINRVGVIGSPHELIARLERYHQVMSVPAHLS